MEIGQLLRGELLRDKVDMRKEIYYNESYAFDDI